MEQKSVWLDEIKFKAKPSLKEDINCDILIIGGGIAGISTALELKDEDGVVLIDKGKIGYGVTSHTTGKLTYLQGSIYDDIEKAHNFKTASRYLESQLYAIKMALDNIKKYGIKCDLEKNNSYLFAAYDVDKLDKMKKFLKKTKIKYEECDLPVNIPNINAIKVNDTFVFHPLKYITSLREIIIKSKVQIYENTRATSISFEKDYYKVTTLEGNIKAKKIIICTHYPFFVIPGLMPLRLSLEKSYALLSPYKNEKFNAINVDDEVYSVRFYKDNIIVGGFSHPLYKNINYKKEEDKLIYFYKKYFNKDIEMAWQTHDLTSHDYLPMIGRLNKNHPNLLIATAFNKWGMTNGILAGKILADLALNKQNKYADLFRLDRPISFTKVTNFITNNFMVGKTYIGTKLIKNKDFYKNVHIEMIDGKCSGIYNDENGEKHIVSNTCPHLKCSLIFNKLDKTWDCPCHGSRFDIDGNLLEGPSVFDIKLK